MARVLFVDQFATFGGGQRILQDVIGHFGRRGHAVKVMLPGRGPFAQRLAARGIEVDEFALRSMRPGRKSALDLLLYPLETRRASAAFARAIAAWRPDLLYVNGPRIFPAAIRAARRSNLPVVGAVHLILRRGASHWVIRRCLRHPSLKAVIFCSREAHAPFAAAGTEKALVVSNWVSSEFFETPDGRDAARALYRAGDRDLLVGVLGSVSHLKGQGMLVRALLPLLPAQPGLRILVGGAPDPSDHAALLELRRLAAASGHSDRMTIEGVSVEAVGFLDALDLLVVPSLGEESFGLAAAEGMARGLPIVATRSGALPGIVVDGVTGALADKDEGSIRAAILPLLADPALRRRLGEAGRVRAAAEFRPERGLSAIERVCFG